MGKAKSHTADQPTATSSLIPIKKIAKLETTQSNAQQNMEPTQNSTAGTIIDNK